MGDTPLWLTLTVGALMAGLLVYPLVTGRAQDYWWVFRAIRPGHVGEAILLAAVTIGLSIGLVTLLPILDISWLNLLMPGESVNLVLLPVAGAIEKPGWPMLAAFAYLILLALDLPLFAASEERMYRAGTKDWRDGAWRSLRFGLAHLKMGIPLYVALALTVPGLWWTLRYFQHGERDSTVRHATYNLTLLAALTVLIGAALLGY